MDDALLLPVRSQWPNKEPVGYDGVQEMQVSFLVKPTNPGDVSSLNGAFSNAWENKMEVPRYSGGSKTKHKQRTPDVTVDTVTLRIGRDGRPMVLIGTFDKQHVQPGGQKVQCKGLVFPGGGHYERIGGRSPASQYEAPHGSSIQAADEETLEEIGVTKKGALLRDCIAVMDVPEYEMRKHCLRIIYGMLVNPEDVPETSDEIKELFWIPLDDLQAIAEGEVMFTLHADTDREEELHFTLKHDKMFLALQKCAQFKRFVKQAKLVAEQYWDTDGGGSKERVPCVGRQ